MCNQESTKSDSADHVLSTELHTVTLEMFTSKNRTQKECDVCPQMFQELWCELGLDFILDGWMEQKQKQEGVSYRKLDFSSI